MTTATETPPLDVAAAPIAAHDNDEEDAKPKEKMRIIMDAASALTSLGDEDDENGANGATEAQREENPAPPVVKEEVALPSRVESASVDTTTSQQQQQKRYLPEHKKPDAAPTFPEKVSVYEACEGKYQLFVAFLRLTNSVLCLWCLDTHGAVSHHTNHV